jgi:hypothetical protein
VIICAPALFCVDITAQAVVGLCKLSVRLNDGADLVCWVLGINHEPLFNYRKACVCVMTFNSSRERVDVYCGRVAFKTVARTGTGPSKWNVKIRSFSECVLKIELRAGVK